MIKSSIDLKEKNRRLGGSIRSDSGNSRPPSRGSSYYEERIVGNPNNSLASALNQGGYHVKNRSGSQTPSQNHSRSNSGIAINTIVNAGITSSPAPLSADTPSNTHANDYFSSQVSQSSQTNNIQIGVPSRPVHSRQASTSSKADEAVENILQQADQIEQEKNELDSLIAENEDLKAHKNRIEEEKNRIEEENRTLKENKEVVKPTSTKSSVSKRLTRPLMTSKRSNQNLTKSTPKATKEEKELDDLKKELSTTKSQNEKLANEKQKLEEERKKSITEHDNKIRVIIELNGTLKDKEETISSKNRIINVKQQSITFKNEKITALEGKIERLNREREQ